MNILILTLIFTVIIYLFFKLSPDRLSKGIKAYDKGDFVAALDLLKDINNKKVLFITATIYKKDTKEKEALDLFIKAHNLGEKKLELTIAKLYGSDYAKAFEWYKKAAEAGEVEAMERLGDIYADGLGVLQDYLYAHYWYNLASSHQSKSAQEKLKQISKRLTPEQIQKAQAIAKESNN